LSTVTIEVSEAVATEIHRLHGRIAELELAVDGLSEIRDTLAAALRSIASRNTGVAAIARAALAEAGLGEGE